MLNTTRKLCLCLCCLSLFITFQFFTSRQTKRTFLPSLSAMTIASPTPHQKHTPLAHTPLAHTPLAHTPLAHTPLAHTPLAHTPLAHTPLAHTPLAHTPLAHTPLATSGGLVPDSRVTDHSVTGPLVESTTEDEYSWKLEDQLLKAIQRLHFKKMTPSKLLLEDPYFTPSYLRDLSLYQDLVLSAMDCREGGQLVILVPSIPNSASERLSIRETWGSAARGKPWPWLKLDRGMDVRLIFVVGLGGASGDHAKDFGTDSPTVDRHLRVAENVSLQSFQGNNESVQNFMENSEFIKRISKRRNIIDAFGSLSNDSWNSVISQIQSEIDAYNDILVLSTVDTYQNLTRKLLNAMKWTIEHCPDSKYIFKVDQDIFVNVPLVWTFLQHHGRSNAIYGYIYGSGLVQRSGKWSVPKSHLPITSYPMYASGNAYIVSTDAVRKIVEMATHFPYVSVEDAFITGILASVTGVDRIHTAGFTRWADGRLPPCHFVADKVYTGNRVDEAYKRVLWKDLDDKHHVCK